ncbi:hypothetical protein GCM10023097_23280 [Streptomyces collinus]
MRRGRAGRGRGETTPCGTGQHHARAARHGQRLSARAGEGDGSGTAMWAPRPTTTPRRTDRHGHLSKPDRAPHSGQSGRVRGPSPHGHPPDPHRGGQIGPALHPCTQTSAGHYPAPAAAATGT